MSNHEQLMKNLGDLFWECRMESGLTQREAAQKAKCRSQGISDIEQGKGNPQLSTLENLALVYGYHVEIALVPIEETEDGPEGAGSSSGTHASDEGDSGRTLGDQQESFSDSAFVAALADHLDEDGGDD